MKNHIIINNTVPVIQYVGDDFATQFDFPFAIFHDQNLEVYLDNTLQLDGYSVTGAGVTGGGYVVFDSAPGDGVLVTLRRNLAIQRTTDYQQSGLLAAKVLNDEFDYQTAALQDVAGNLGRSLRVAVTDEAADLVLPAKAARAGKTLGFDAEGGVTVADSPDVSPGITNHSELIGLEDDDHPHYLTAPRADTWLTGKTTDDLPEGSASKYMRLAGPGSAVTAARSDHHHTGTYEPAFAKKSAFNRNFGSGATDVARGNHTHSFELGELGNVSEAGREDGFALVWSAASATWEPRAQRGEAGSGGGLENAYASVSDGVDVASAVGAASLRIRSGDGSVTPTVANNDPALGDNVDLRVTFGGKGSAGSAAHSDHDHAGEYEPPFAKNTAFNKNFGTGAGEVAEGNHSHGVELMYVVDEKPRGTHGGDATAGSRFTRVLNTVKVNTIAGAALSGNRLTLPAGTYRISVVAPAFYVHRSKVWLRDMTAGIDLATSSNSYFRQDGAVGGNMNIEGVIVLSSTTEMELQQRVESTKMQNGLGVASDFGVETYTQVCLQKIL